MPFRTAEDPIWGNALDELADCWPAPKRTVSPEKLSTTLRAAKCIFLRCLLPNPYHPPPSPVITEG